MPEFPKLDTEEGEAAKKAANESDYVLYGGLLAAGGLLFFAIMIWGRKQDPSALK